MGPSVSGVGVLDKAITILDALASGPHGLAGLATATGLPRATTHRLAVALEAHGLVARDVQGRFELGARIGELARAGSLAEIARPALARLRDTTGESTQLYVVQGDDRVCAVSLESPHSLRTIVPVGAVLPMSVGSAGRVLRGFANWAESVEEREPGVASVSAPVVVDGQIIAAVSVSGPVERTTRAPGRRYAAAVVEAARGVERALSGTASARW